jgi:dTDP-4-dehydrorhamnose reductase
MSVRPRLLVTGAGGMVGGYVPKVYRDYELILTDVVPGYVPMDVRDPAAVMATLARERPDVVLHLAAATDVDRCEQEPDEAFRSNASGTQNVALACLEQEILLVMVSTAAVFWGDKPEPYVEFDTPRPANVYGRSKLAGEEIVSSLLQRYAIVRTGWMIGGGEKDKKFVGKLARMMTGGMKALKVVNDKWGSPTYAKDLLEGIERLIQRRACGLYHVANEGFCSRYEIALQIRELLRCPEVELRPVSSEEFPLPAPRGRSEAIQSVKLEMLGFPRLRSWKKAIREYIEKELSGVQTGP